MSAWLRTLWNGILLREPAFADLRDHRNAFWYGLAIIAAVALLIHLPTLVGGVSAALRAQPVAVEMDQAMSELEQAIQQLRPLFGGMSDEMAGELMAQFKDGLRLGFEIAGKVETLPTYLPKPADRTLQAIGRWVSQPFAGGGFPLANVSLGAWLGYGIWVMLFAKLLGGRGTLAGFFGATALYAVPHVLRVFAFAPAVGPALSVIAYLWGAAVYVKATAVGHQMSVERALLAVLLPALIALLLAIMVATALATVIAIGLAGAMD